MNEVWEGIKINEDEEDAATADSGKILQIFLKELCKHNSSLRSLYEYKALSLKSESALYPCGDSNAGPCLRRAVLYPLSYRGNPDAF